MRLRPRFTGVKAHEEQAFSAFVQTYGDRLLRFGRLLFLDPGEAEDALQTALLRLTGHWSRGIESPEAYVRMTLVNLARDGARRQHLVPVPVDDATATAKSSDDHADAYGARARLDALLALAPPRQRVTIVLRVIEGYSEAETAHLMRCSPGTVKSNLARGLDRLRTNFPTNEETSRRPDHECS